MIKGTVKRLIEKYPYLPLGLFVGLPLGLVAAFYILHSKALTLPIAIFSAVLLSLFCYYLAVFRQEDLAVTGSAIPNILGPTFAYIFVQGNDSPLRTVVEHGG